LWVLIVRLGIYDDKYVLPGPTGVGCGRKSAPRAAAWL
jgi:hypothetical protein